MGSLQVLIIDDEPAIRQVLAAQLLKGGHQVDQADGGTAALARLKQGDVDVALCDIRMPGMTGIEVVEKTRSEGIDTVFVMITAFASVDTAIEAMKAGAFEYLTKPVRPEDVLQRLEKIESLIRLRDENARLRDQVENQQGGLCCQLPSPAMQKVEKLIARISATKGTVLITGSSGSGKGVVARTLHRRSSRSDRPFIQVNCGAIPENLLESELFGHLKGAFTGADRTKKGLFREADGGTLFLDEIGELPMSMQVKLLHAIEEQSIRAVGSEQARTVDVRIIAATNRDIEEMVKQGEFREDLYYRINVLQIHIPSLHERKMDIPPLLEFFMAHEAAQLGMDKEFVTDSEFEEAFLDYDWPGNVRELKNVIQRVLLLAEGDVITVDDLPFRFREYSNLDGTSGDMAGVGDTLREQVRRYELKAIHKAIDDMGGDRQKAAKRLGIGTSTLYRKLEEEQEKQTAETA